MAKKNFCLNHGAEYWVLDDFHGHMRYELLPNQVLYCSGPFASCPPPELPVDWMENLVEPSPAELERMELSAKELELQFS